MLSDNIVMIANFTHLKKHVQDCIRRSIKVERLCAFNRHFQSKQFDGISSTIKQHLKIYGKEVSTVIEKNLEYIAITEKKHQKLFEGF